ncbi:methionyl-tRNA formyltransferase [Candidatus Pelagibacter sp.]|nr:methionyl-tRNA formyltransferase [Candidatus Pelagibacter sp.]|tara:strand:- start:1617 stop:2546 length:930 start_codon:yes stop_codon:yes gene_type:complete
MQKKIAFMGTPIFSVPILKNIYQNGYEISAVYTQPPRKSNRGLKLEKSPIHSFAETINFNVRTPDLLKNNKSEYEYFKNLDLDLVIIVAYGIIIPKEFLSLSKEGFINLHASILPKWRGAAPIQRSIMSQDKETGISVMRINEKLDEGDVSHIFKISVEENENAEGLSDRLSILASEKISEVIDSILDKQVNFKPQDHSKATYAEKIKKSEGLIDWNDKAENIIGKINGLFPYPGGYFIYKGERFKILKAQISFNKDQPGKVISNYLEISCGENSIKILEIQREGKKPQKIDEFVLGSQIQKGTILSNV